MSYPDIGPTRRTVLKMAGAALAAAGGTGVAGADEHNDARLRVVHASPDAPPAVDVYVDDDEILSDVSYGTVSDYLSLEPGEYEVAVVPAGEDRDAAVIKADVDLDGRDYTAAAVGELDDDSLELLVLEDDNRRTKFDTARLRLVHASPDAPAVDVTTEVELAEYARHLGFPRVALKITLADDLAFGEATDYRALKPGEYPVDVREEDEDDRVFDTDLEVEEDVVYTVFAIGYVDPDDDDDDRSFDLLVASEETDNGGFTD